MKFKIPFSKAFIGEEEKKAVCDVMDSGWLTTGNKTKEFEEEFAKYVGAPYAVFVSSCTAALAMAIEYINPKKVIVPSLTFAATVNEVVRSGAEPIFTDVDDNFCLSFNSVCENHKKFKEDMIVAVHLTGNKSEYFGPVIYDSAHRIEKNDYTGGIWCYSFYPTKNMTTGEGGMLASDDLKFIEWARQARHHGIDKSIAERYGRSNTWKYDVSFIGTKYNNTDIAAAIGLEQLKKLPYMTQRRNEIVKMYNEILGYNRAGNHLYPIVVELNHRSRFIDKMAEAGIQCSVHFLPLHKMTAYKEHNKENLPNTNWYGGRLVSLPLYPSMTDEEVKYVANIALKTNLLKK